MEKKVCKNKAGFTLIEMLVVLGITGILSSVGLISYQSAKSEAALRAAQREVATVIRMAQSYALQGKIQDINVGGTNEKRTPCGYGFEFTNANTYRIFYTYKKENDKTCDDAGNREYPAPRATANANAGESQSFELPTDVTMTLPANANDTRFYFTIPFGDVYDKSGPGHSNLEMAFTYGDYTKRINVNERGDVDELD